MLSIISKSKQTISILIVLTLVLSGCGFQLRQAFTLPPQYLQVAIVSQQATLLTQLLTQTLNRKEIPIIDINELNKNPLLREKTLIIHLNNEKISEQVPTTVNNEITAYDINLQVNFATNKNKIQSLQVSQRLNIDQQQLLSTASEQNLTQQDLRRKMIQRITTKIRYAK